MQIKSTTRSLPQAIFFVLMTATITLPLQSIAIEKNQAQPTVSAKNTPLTAAQSNPKTMGWMQGSMPAADKVIRITDPDFFAFPKLRWTVCHFRELMPTIAVDNGHSHSSEIPTALDTGIDQVSFTPLNSDQSMTWNEAFDANYTDGMLVIHRGKIVYERYDGCLDDNTLHAVMSVTKSLTGLLAEALISEGKLDQKALVVDIIPELKGSAFADATVQQVLDMTTSLNYSEDYSDPTAEVWTYAQAGSPMPKPAGYNGPRSYFEYLQTVTKQDQHGDAFGYKTINADTAGWLVARTTGLSVADYLSTRIWSQIGAEREAFYTVDSTGTPFAGGGFNATLRDLGRIGLLVLNEGRWMNKQIIPAEAIQHIRQGGNQHHFAKAGYQLLTNWSYRSMWWVSHNDHGAFAARGVHGQTIWIDPKAEMVIVRVASHPAAANNANDPFSLPAYQAVAEYLLGK